MSDRGLTSATLTALDAEVVEYYDLIRADLPASLYYTTGPYDIEYNGNTYESTALLKPLPDINETLTISPNTTSISFGGASQAVHALTLTQDYRNADLYWYRHWPATGQTVLIYQGQFDSYSTSEDARAGKSTVTWSIANHWTNWEAINGRYIADEEQQRLYSGDKFFEFTGVTDPVLDYWGRGSKGLTSADFQARRDLARGITLRESSPYYGYHLGTYDWQARSHEAAVLPTVYGTAALPGTVVFRDTSGTNNEYLWVVYALSEGECDSLTDIKYEGKSYNDADFNGKISYWFKSGSTTQTVETNLDTASTEWTSAHTGKGICYVVVRYTYDQSIFNGEPKPQFILKGKKLYDPRDYTTAWSDNPALVLYDYLTATPYGKSLRNTQLADINAGADFCETQYTDHGGEEGGTPGTINVFGFNGVIDNSESIKKNTEAILFCMRAHLPWIAGLYTLVIERGDESSVYSFSEDNITGAFDRKEASRSKMINVVYYTYIDPDINYAEATRYLESASYISADNDVRHRRDITNKYEHSAYRAYNRCNTELKKSREAISVKLRASRADALRIEVGKVIDITRVTEGWTNKLFRVTALTILASGGIACDVQEFEPTVYNWGVSTEFPIPADTTLPDPFNVTAPTGFTVASGSANQIITDDGTKVNRMKISFTASADAYVYKYEIQYKLTADSAYTTLPPLIVDGSSTYTAFTEGVQNNAGYDIRIRAVNSLERTSAWVTTTHTVTGTQVVGIYTELPGGDAIGNASYFRHETFDTLDAFGSKVQATLDQVNGYAKLRGNGASGGGTVWYISHDVYTTTFTFYDKNRYLQGNVTPINVASWAAGKVGLIYTGDYASDHIGIQFKWNSGTSKVDIYAISGDHASSQTFTLITSINDNTQFSFDIVSDYGVNVIAHVDGANETIITTTLPASATTNPDFVFDVQTNDSGVSNGMNIHDLWMAVI